MRIHEKLWPIKMLIFLPILCSSPQNEKIYRDFIVVSFIKHLVFVGGKIINVTLGFCRQTFIFSEAHRLYEKSFPIVPNQAFSFILWNRLYDLQSNCVTGEGIMYLFSSSFCLCPSASISFTSIRVDSTFYANTISPFKGHFQQ